MGVAAAINDLLGNVSRRQRVLLNHYEAFLVSTAMPAVGLDEAVRRALSAGEIQLIESVPLEIAGDLRNFRFSLPQETASGPMEE